MTNRSTAASGIVAKERVELAGLVAVNQTIGSLSIFFGARLVSEFNDMA